MSIPIYNTNTFTMAPPMFHDQVVTFTADVASSVELCNTIRTTRKLGSTVNLDALQSSLVKFNRSMSTYWRTKISDPSLTRQLERGDDNARAALAECINSLRSNIKNKLTAIVQPHQRQHGEKEKPGFGRMKDTFVQLGEVVFNACEALIVRIQSQAPQPAPRPAPNPRNDPTAVLVSRPEDDPRLREILNFIPVDELVATAYNTWIEETSPSGRTYFINVVDVTRKQYEYPEGGFVKRRVSGFEAPTRRNTGSR
jgi:hypothetical protein